MRSGKRKDDWLNMAYEMQLKSPMEISQNIEADLELKARILVLLENTEYDFLRLETLALECSVDQEMMQQALNELEPMVRKAISYEEQYDTWYRLTSKGLTKGEKKMRRHALMTHTALRNDDF